LKTLLYINDNTLNDSEYKNMIENYVAVLQPVIPGNENFLPVGDIVVTLDQLEIGTQSDVPNADSLLDTIYIKRKQPNLKTMLVNGSAAHPEDYQLMFENRYYQDESNKIQSASQMPLTIWKPVAPEGFTALGYVFKNSFEKPSKEEIYCVSNDFIKEKPYEPNFYENVFDHKNSSINIWKRDSKNQTFMNNYVQVNNTRPVDENDELKVPNPFDYQHYVINLNTGDYKDRLYLDDLIENNESDKKSCNFLIKLSSKKYTNNSDNKRYDKLLEIEGVESKLMSFTKNTGGSTMCMGLPQPYVSSYYKEVNSNTSGTSDSMVDSKLMGMACGDSSNFGTNFRHYNDYSIRLSDNNKNCVTHKPTTNGVANKDIEDPYNFLYLSECDKDLKNQLFTVDDNRLKVLADGGNEPNACVTISPDKTLRLEECGDQKFTALRLWDEQITREDKCFKEEADKVLQESSNIEVCEDKSYFVIYLDGIMKTEEFCEKEPAFQKYNEIVNQIDTTAIAGAILVHRNNVLQQSMSEIPAPFQNEANNVTLKRGNCYNCKSPSRMLCSKQRLEESTYNSFNNFDEEQRLMKYCMTMRDIDDFRCGRTNRQKFLNFPVPEDFCLNFGKTVYVQFPEILDSEILNSEEIDSEISDEIKTQLKKIFEREPNINLNNQQEQLPIQNLLNEYYNTQNYSVFLRASLRPGREENKFKLLFDLDSISSELQPLFKPFSVYKNSEYICPDYEPKESMLRVGSKVLVTFDNFYSSGEDNFEVGAQRLDKSGIKYFGVVIKKYSPKYYRVMLSINSYESNYNMNNKVGVKYYESNPAFNVDIKNLTLFKRAEICL
jgi:hypothetical protein